jgi:CBS domain-containing protein
MRSSCTSSSPAGFEHSVAKLYFFPMSTEVITVAPETPADEAARLLLTNKLGCVPVVDPGGIVGIVTETDFVRVAYAMLAATTSSVEHRC